MPVEEPRQPDPAAAPPFREVLDSLRPPIEQIEQGFATLRVTLDALAEHLAGGSGGPKEGGGQASRPPSVPQVQEPLPPPPPARQTPLDEMLAEPSPAPSPGESPGPIATGQAAGNWSRILFGDRFSKIPALPHLSGQLLADVYDEDPHAIGLAGQLMTFRTATGEQKPRMLKDVGESFYAWKPQGDPPLIEPLIAWLHAELEAAELGNRIQVVHPGDRYDMQRHNARQPGVEVADVRGWAVLRENGKVYSKANVSVR